MHAHESRLEGGRGARCFRVRVGQDERRTWCMEHLDHGVALYSRSVCLVVSKITFVAVFFRNSKVKPNSKSVALVSDRTCSHI